LLHNSGFPPDPTPYWYDNVTFGCPQSFEYYPQEDFSCQTQIYYAIMNQTLEFPIGAQYNYSDINFITMLLVVGNLGRALGYVNQSNLIPTCNTGGPGIDQCYGEAYIRMYVIEPLNLTRTGYLPNQNLWSQCAPTLNDTSYRHITVQGQVEDPNSYAMGGIAGHAGLFSTAEDLFTLTHKILFAPEKDSFMNSTTMELFIREYNHSQSSRAIGWNTNDYYVNDRGWDQSCGTLSQKNFYARWIHWYNDLCGS